MIFVIAAGEGSIQYGEKLYQKQRNTANTLAMATSLIAAAECSNTYGENLTRHLLYGYIFGHVHSTSTLLYCSELYCTCMVLYWGTLVVQTLQYWVASLLGGAPYTQGTHYLTVQ
jgi:hypothetical protein